MSFRVRGLSPEPFRKYFAMSNEELHAMGAVRVVADGDTYPCRVSLGHARRGDELVLLNYEHQPGHSPYRSNHAIYVARGSGEAFDDLDVIPEALRIRLLSVRAFDKNHMIVDADITDGKDAAALFERFLANAGTEYLHVHNAKRGCYAAKVERA